MLKVQLFDDDDFKKAEELLFRALVRAMRVVAKENLVQGYKPPAPEKVVAQEELPLEATPARPPQRWMVMEELNGKRDTQYVVAASFAEAVRLARQQRGWGGDIIHGSIAATPGRRDETTPPAPQPAPATQAPPAPAPFSPALIKSPPSVADAPKKRKPRLDLRELLKTVGPRPEGYIERQEAVKLIGGDKPAESAISLWVLTKQIPAVICASAKPPAKGLPGRVMVERRAVLERNELRKKNTETQPMLRRHRDREQQQQASNA